MTGHFTPGGELRCRVCEYQVGSLAEPDCLIAVELRDDGEQMHASCCPEPATYRGPLIACPVRGGPLPCPSCLTELRMAS
jgi:hypothetical protein